MQRMTHSGDARFIRDSRTLGLAALAGHLREQDAVLVTLQLDGVALAKFLAGLDDAELLG